MKPKLSVVGGAAVTGLFVVTLLPVLLLATGSPDGTCGVVADASTDAIAATTITRLVEVRSERITSPPRTTC